MSKKKIPQEELANLLSEKEHEIGDIEKSIASVKNIIEKRRFFIECFIRIPIFFVLLVILFLVSRYFLWPNSWMGNLFLAIFFAFYPGIFFWGRDFNKCIDWILGFSENYQKLTEKLLKYESQRQTLETEKRILEAKKEVLEEKIRIAKDKERLKKLRELENIYKNIFNRRIDSGVIEQSKRFFAIEKDLMEDYFYLCLFDHDFRTKLDALSQYSKRLKERIDNFWQDSKKAEGRGAKRRVNAHIEEEDAGTDIDGREVRLRNIEDLDSKKYQKNLQNRINERKPTKIKIDFLKQSERNVELGLKGELIVLDWEKKSLAEAGLGELSEKVKHISQELGDGSGFDILSYGHDGKEKFIEVKTTKQGGVSQFYLTENELNFIKSHNNCFLYRLNLKNESEAELTIISKDDFMEKFETSPYQYVVRLKNQ